MATWVNHLRIAEGLISEFGDLNSVFFVMGNMAPDGGKPNRNHSAFIPEKKVTHWENEEGKIDADKFVTQYINNSKGNNYLFYLGYYCHLLIDIEWRKLFEKKVARHEIEFATRKELINAFKHEWYGYDCIYLKEHKNFIYYTHYINQKSFHNSFLDYYDKDAFEKQIKYVKTFYRVLMSNNTEVAGKYLTEKENEDFVRYMIDLLKNNLIIKGKKI